MIDQEYAEEKQERNISKTKCQGGIEKQTRVKEESSNISQKDEMSRMKCPQGEQYTKRHL